MAGPELTDKLEGPLWKLDQPVLSALDVANIDQAVRAVVIGNTQIYSLLQAKPARVDDDQATAIDRKTNEAKDAPAPSDERTTGSFFSCGGQTKSRWGISRERICR